MLLKNSADKYGLVAKVFHWVMAILIIGMLCLGLYMTGLPNSLAKLQLYGYHKATGILILFLVSLRLAWRLINISPTPAPMPNWQRISAYTLHFAIYIFMFAIPITGWLISSAAGIPVSFFGLFLMPDLLSPNERLIDVFEQIHESLAFILIGMICLHILAALKHHFINKDNTLRKIL